MSTELIRRASINDLVAHRNHALELYGQAHDILVDAGQAYAAAAPGGGYVYTGARDEQLFRLVPRDEWMKTLRESVDRSVWAHLMQVGQFELLMDRTEREKWRDQIAKEPPELTVETAEATFGRLLEDRAEIFKRGVAKAFSGLDRRFRSHDGFKIGDKIILSYFHSDGHVSFGRRATLDDVERAFYILDGKDPPGAPAPKKPKEDDEPPPKRIGDLASSGLGFRSKSCEVENAYFRLKAFKNGNAHLLFKRDDLVSKVNKLLEEYYGENLLGDGRADDSYQHRNRAGHAKNYGFFPTPPEVAARVVDEAKLYVSPGVAPLRILEPSAGDGALVKEIYRAHTGTTPRVIAVEIDRERAKQIQLLGFPNLSVGCNDFLEMTPKEAFDRVIMNPPFDGGRDVDHVLHAMKFVKPGGRLIAIMSAGAEWRNDKRTVEFRKTAEAWAPKGTYGDRMWHDLPPESFVSVGTKVNTVILSLQRPF